MSEQPIQTGDLVRDDADAPLARDEAGGEDRGGLEPLFDADRADQLRERWHALQAQFVDDPQATVKDADALVAEALQDLAQGFDTARSSLEAQWTRGDDVSTEELRVTLQRYRSFFERLLEV